MELTNRQQEIQSIITQAFHKANENIDFKARLVKSPLEVIENLAGYKISESEIVDVINKDFTDEIIINDLELNDAQLELVAGGNLKKKWDDFVSVISSFFP